MCHDKIIKNTELARGIVVSKTGYKSKNIYGIFLFKRKPYACNKREQSSVIASGQERDFI